VRARVRVYARACARTRARVCVRVCARVRARVCFLVRGDAAFKFAAGRRGGPDNDEGLLLLGPLRVRRRQRRQRIVLLPAAADTCLGALSDRPACGRPEPGGPGARNKVLIPIAGKAILGVFGRVYGVSLRSVGRVIFELRFVRTL
jgi:hypothetical protein